MIIDTHIHLYDKRYSGQIDNIIKEAFENDVRKMIVVGYDYQTSIDAIKLAEQYEHLYASVGLHPSSVSTEQDVDLNWIKELLKHKKVVAVGEAGLDYYWDKTYKDKQIALFIKQIEIAREHKLPIIIHNRDASGDIFDILKKHRIRGVLHCYSASLELAKEFVKIGYYLGVGGVVTFKNSKEIKKVVQDIELKHLLCETDGPYLAPTPYRGQLNKPSYLKYIIEEISKLKNVNIEDVKLTLERNTKDLFNI